MLNLNDREWKAFELGHIFKNYHGKRLVTSMRVQGCNPLLTAGNTHNGVTEFIENPDMPYFNDFVSVDMFGNAFYHPYNASGDDNIYFFKNDQISECAKLFIVTCINNQKEKFSYGKQFRQYSADNTRVMLPVADDGNPDYAFMEKYIREREDKHKQKYTDFVNAEFETLPLPLEKKTWSEFFIGDLFIVKRPKARSEKNYDDGKYPFVASGNFNNGVIRCCEPCIDEVLDKGNCITVSPVDGSAFYQKSNFLGRGGAGSSVILLYSDKINKFSGIFLSRAIRQTCSKYNYGKMGSQDNIKREKILLPVTEDGQPDYEYMEQYTKAIMFKKYKSYLEYQSSKTL